MSTSGTASAAIPAHVAGDRVFHFDIYQPITGDGDYHAWYRRVHDEEHRPDVYWTACNGGHWVVQRGEVFNSILKDPESFTSKINVVPRERAMPTPLIPINLDPPAHTKYRALLTQAFSPKAVAPMAEQARELTHRLIDGFYARGSCEFASEFARILPIAIFMKMAGIPEADREHLLKLVDDLIRPANPDDMSAGYGFIQYAQAAIAERRAHPGDDLLSHLVQVSLDGEPLDDGTLIGMFILLLNGGLDTVASVLGFAMRFLAHNPALRKQLAQTPASIPNAVEELLRRFPVSTLVRMVTKDLVIGDVAMRAGDLVLMQTSAHGIDPREFADPLEVDFGRKIVFHGSFGNGPHRCLGSMLARTELKAFLEVWFQRIPDFRVRPGVELTIVSGMVLTLERLPLEWDVH